MAYPWGRVWLAMNKDTNISHYQTINLLKIWFLFLVSTKGQTRDKGEFITKFVVIVVTIIFVWKSLSNLQNIFLHGIFPLITWNTKPWRKQFLESHQPVHAIYVHIFWRAFQLLWIFFWSCWFIWQSIFDHFQIFLIWFFNYFFARTV